jgi:hypothetical protein
LVDQLSASRFGGIGAHDGVVVPDGRASDRPSDLLLGALCAAAGPSHREKELDDVRLDEPGDLSTP